MIKRLKQWWKNFEYWRWPPKKKTADKKLNFSMKTTGLFPTLVVDRGMETETLIKERTESTKKPRCTCPSCLKADGLSLQDVQEELPPAQQGLHEVEIDPNTLTLEEDQDGNRIKFTGPINTESDGDDRVSVAVSILIPPSSDHPLYDRYAYEFEKSMWMLVEKCLALSEKFKRDDLDISAFAIEATLFLRAGDADVIFEDGVPSWLNKVEGEEDEVNDDREDNGFPHIYPDPSAGDSGLFTDDPEPGNRRPHWLNEALRPLKSDFDEEGEKPPTEITDFPMKDAFPKEE